MGLWPAQGDEKYLLFGNHTQWKRRPPLLSSRPERSVVERSAVQRTFSWECFSTERTRSGEISVWMLSPGNVFRQNIDGPAGPPKKMKTARANLEWMLYLGFHHTW